MTEKIIFTFTATYNSRFDLDGTFYTIVGTKPPLPPNRTFKAIFIEKQGAFIYANVLNGTGRKIIIEVK